MNATYEQTSPSDAGQMLGVSAQTVAAWCRNGIIRSNDISNGTKKARYVIPDDELNRVYNLIQKYGKRKWMLYNELKKKPVGSEPEVYEPEVVESEDSEYSKYERRFDSKADEIARTILYIQDIKERLEDLEAERNQLTTELEQLRNEVLVYIE